MCGIVGYIGKKNALSIIIDGLKRLEYRGYDSAGISIFNSKNELQDIKKAGRVNDLEELINAKSFQGTIGIGHTRWATHGEPNDINAHPHSDMSGEIRIVHNGIIENYKTLKTRLTNDGYKFQTDTDTEILADLIHFHHAETGSFETAVRLSLSEVEGTYGIACLHSKEPDKIIAARKGSPLMLGIGQGETIVASDASAIINHTKNVIYLEDGEMAIITKKGFNLKTIEDKDIFREIQKLLRHLLRREHVVGQARCDGASGHGRIFSLIRVLDENEAACLLDRLRADRPVRASARQNHGEAVVVLVRKRAEELIDGRPFPSWFVERESCNFVVCYQEPAVRRDDIDLVRFEWNLPVHLLHRHLGFSSENFGKLACVVRVKVHDHHKRCAGVWRNFLKELLKRRDAASRCADADSRKAYLNLRFGRIFLAFRRLSLCHVGRPIRYFLLATHRPNPLAVNKISAHGK